MESDATELQTPAVKSLFPSELESPVEYLHDLDHDNRMNFHSNLESRTDPIQELNQYISNIMKYFESLNGKIKELKEYHEQVS